MRIKLGSKKKVKNQFVIFVGDEGAILCHYMDNALSSRVFVDSPLSEDVQLFEKLLASYPSHPVSLLVDVMEQSYTQQVLPPVSSMGLVSQINRRMKRDLREEDLNNFVVTGRSVDGRKDWNVFFISLGYTEPFSKWLEFILQQRNKFGGVYLLPVESVSLIRDLKTRLSDSQPPEWEILLLHNKTGGFRIITFREEKLVFARLAQNLIGESIPEVVVGNLEQELQNTFEYLKRLGFRVEATSKLTIVSSSEILEKLDTKLFKYGEVNLFSPYEISEIVGLPDTVNPKDKFADVFMASHFAAQKKHGLKFHTKQTKVIESFYTARKAVIALLFALLIGGIGYETNKIVNAMAIYDEIDLVQKEFKSQSNQLNQGTDSLKKTDGADTDKMVSIYNLYKLLPSEKYRLLSVLSKISPEFGKDKIITSISYVDGNNAQKEAAKASGQADAAKQPVNLAAIKTEADKYSVTIAFDFMVLESKSEQINNISAAFLEKVKKLLPGMEVSYTKAPTAKPEGEFEFLAERIDVRQDNMATFPVEMRIATANAPGASK